MKREGGGGEKNKGMGAKGAKETKGAKGAKGLKGGKSSGVWISYLTSLYPLLFKNIAYVDC